MRKVILTVLLTFIILSPANAQGSFNSISIEVYNTGYVRVTEIFVPSNVTVVIEVPLLTKDVEALSVADENGNPVPFEQNGSTVEVYLTANVSFLNITYFTTELTSKQGDVWTLTFSSPIPVTVTFPSGTVIVDLSDVPLKISGNSITMPPGNQSISYTLPLPITETTTETSTTSTITETSTTKTTSSSTTKTSTTAQTSSESRSSSSSPAPTSSPWPVLGAVVLVLLAGAGFFLWNRSGKGNTEGEDELVEKLKALDLSEEEMEALLYIHRHGGRARQADVRTALGLPKTTAWRMFNRLAERGLVRIYKKGKENWVELKL
ncbi:MarR family transcriptional regulator [Thermococcus sp.]|uniref:helix-turn-helix transcriptional regulator n=1 Tax=Thermococcus sp. TaxID=35749 RepID=UPI00261FC171|nr:MarR family transcriptional regulator [Thermococcus sp.]